MADLPPHTNVRILASQKAGHVVACAGLANALGVEAETRSVEPRGLYRFLAPFAPPDPRELPSSGGGAIAEPFPDILIASARETIAYARALKRAAGGKTFSVFLGDPRYYRSTFDLIWAPAHDRLSGTNVISTLTSPHPHSAAARAKLHQQPDPRLHKLSAPRVALLIGGPNSRFAFGAEEQSRLLAAVRSVLDQGASLMISPSRRTPEGLIEQIAKIVEPLTGADSSRVFIWTSGPNPYAQMLAMADSFLVTSDSVNMIGEALSTGKPVYMFKLAGNPGKFQFYFETLLEQNLVREWDGQLDVWSYIPVDATPVIAAQVTERYLAFRASHPHSHSPASSTE